MCPACIERLATQVEAELAPSELVGETLDKYAMTMLIRRYHGENDAMLRARVLTRLQGGR
jgi:hypothetical protein